MAIVDLMNITEVEVSHFFQQSLFYFFAALAIGSALFMIIAKNPVRSVLSLVLTFFAMGAVWVLLQAEFLAMTLVLVYVGAVMVLFMFVIMMLDIEYATLHSAFIKYLPLGIVMAVLVAASIIYAVGTEHSFPIMQLNGLANSESSGIESSALSNNLTGSSNATVLGTLLFTQYLYPFEIAGVLLLVAIIAAISLTFRGRQHRKAQDPDQQVLVRKQDRLQILKMKPSLKEEG